MEEKTIQGLKWIVKILNKNNIPYRIGGGFASYVYGSTRPVGDIDISLSGKYFPIIIPEVSEYITAGPKHYLNEKWDCNTLSLGYNEQEIDMTDVDTLKMSNKERTEWIQSKELYSQYNPMVVSVGGIDVSLFHPRGLIAYKKELGGEHQEVDIEAIQKYITKNKL